MNFKLNKKMLIFLSKSAKNSKKVPNSRRRSQSIVILRSPKAIGSKSFGDFVESNAAFRPYFRHCKVRNICNKALSRACRSVVSRACRSEVGAFLLFFASRIMQSIMIKSNLFIVGILFLLSSCSTLSGGGQIANTDMVNQEGLVEDTELDIKISTLERFNYAMFYFNEGLDKAILKPVSKLYRRVTPNAVEKGVSRFFSNLRMPITIVNQFLQGKFVKGLSDTGRFLVNSTIGIAGIFDPASAFGIPKNTHEDFGQTFAKWGVSQGPYVVLPFLGPRTLLSAGTSVGELAYLSSIRELSNTVDSEDIDPNTLSLSASAIDFIQQRSSLLDQEDIISGDKYEFYKQAYLQLRTYLINDGKVAEEEEDLDWLDE